MGLVEPGSGEVTRLLADCRAGREDALERIVPLVYDELRQLAGRQIQGESPGHTLQATALVNEAWLRLVEQRHRDWANKGHFLAIAATAMRRVLINHARARGARKRGGDAGRVSLFESVAIFEERAEDLLALDEALDALAEVDDRKRRVVELRFFAGLACEETARVLDVSERTVERDWRLAKAWLRREMGAGGSGR
jgi:RNA polymerase sigma factor (TIGR02999 family)